MTKNQVKFFLDQHGCAKNQVDGELLISHLESTGGETVAGASHDGAVASVSFVQTFDAAESDIIIINSCGFINSAKEESINSVLEAKKNYPNAKIILAGCLAERYADDFRENFPELDGIFGNGDISKIVEVAKEVVCASNGANVAAHKFLRQTQESKQPRQQKQPIVLKPEQKGVCCGERKKLLSFPSSAYVKITEGCNNRCSFCAIPIIRGSLRSRPVKEIVDEIKTLVARGIYEINLIGQDLAAFGTEDYDAIVGSEKCRGIGAEFNDSPLCVLLKEISDLKGDFIVRLLYIHPDHFNFDIIPVLKSDKRILPYFDIPIQSGDDEIIKKMNRHGTAAIYKMMIKKIREELPDCAIRTTFLTGFPGETEEQAENTANFLKEIEPDWSGCFDYSREEDTAAYSMKPQVPKKLSKARADNLIKIQAEITKKRLAARVGKEYDVLIEEVLEANEENPGEGFAIGRAWFQAPEVDGNVVVRFNAEDKAAAKAIKPGAIVRVFVDASGDVDVEGRFCGYAAS